MGATNCKCLSNDFDDFYNYDSNNKIKKEYNFNQIDNLPTITNTYPNNLSYSNKFKNILEGNINNFSCLVLGEKHSGKRSLVYKCASFNNKVEINNIEYSIILSIVPKESNITSNFIDKFNCILILYNSSDKHSFFYAYDLFSKNIVYNKIYLIANIFSCKSRMDLLLNEYKIIKQKYSNIFFELNIPICNNLENIFKSIVNKSNYFI